MGLFKKIGSVANKAIKFVAKNQAPAVLFRAATGKNPIVAHDAENTRGDAFKGGSALLGGIVAATAAGSGGSGLADKAKGLLGGISGGFNFGQDQKKVNVVFWIIAAVVVVLIIRPFLFLSGGRKRSRK